MKKVPMKNEIKKKTFYNKNLYQLQKINRLIKTKFHMATIFFKLIFKI